MLNLILRLFPARFRKEMGRDWLLDTRMELEQARAAGVIALVRWCARFMLGTAGGVLISHAHHAKAAAKLIRVTAGDGTVLVGEGAARNRFALHTALATAGALIAGYMCISLFITFWIEGSIEKFTLLFQTYGASPGMIVGIGPPLFQLALLLWGIHLVASHRMRSTFKLIPLSQWFGVALVFLAAISTGFLNWTLRDMGERATQLSDVFDAYPGLVKEMNLNSPDQLNTLSLEPGSAHCERAEGAFSMKSQEWMKVSQSSGELVPLILLQGVSTHLWTAGCWSEETLMTYNQSLIAATQITPLKERRLRYEWMGQAEAARNIVLPGVGFSRETWCLTQAPKILGEQLDSQKAIKHCAGIENAAASVHTHGAYRLSANTLSQLVKS